MPTRDIGPDAIIIGAPKAGTSALHAALAQHPQIYASPVKEPKYFMCADAPPPAYNGPGDAHSQQEWVWRRRDYEAPFAAERPDARLIVIVRDPIDRAYSNWMHLWVDGLEPEADFVAAWRREQERIDAGWAPFWHYRRMGHYGEQLADLFERVDRDRVLVLRYFQLVSHPVETLNRVSRFLGIAEDRIGIIAPDNSRPFVEPGLRTQVLGRVVRTGASAGRLVPPQVWRRASRPLLAALRHGGPERRPKLGPEQRTALLAGCHDDIARLEDVLGESFEDWRSPAGRGSFAERTRTP